MYQEVKTTIDTTQELKPVRALRVAKMSHDMGSPEGKLSEPSFFRWCAAIGYKPLREEDENSQPYKATLESSREHERRGCERAQ
jgi:hypothetical protein